MSSEVVVRHNLFMSLSRETRGREGWSLKTCYHALIKGEAKQNGIKEANSVPGFIILWHIFQSAVSR